MRRQDQPVSGPSSHTAWPSPDAHRIQGVLFDLDGTLLHTAPDITAALNAALAERRLSALPESTVSLLIGRGAPTLVERAYATLGVVAGAQAKAETLERFFAHYGELASTPADHEAPSLSQTQPYPGVEAGLKALHELGLRMAVVTNKQHRFAVTLLQRLGLSGYFDLVVGGDSCERRKPDPQPLTHACEALHLAPSQVLMVGDSVNDVQAARAAGLPIVCVPYGYNEGLDPRDLDCDRLIDSVGVLPDLLVTVALTSRAA